MKPRRTAKGSRPPDRASRATSAARDGSPMAVSVRATAPCAPQPSAITGSAADFIPQRPTLPKLRAAAQGCRGCALYACGTQAVFGEGPRTARVLVVGEQPGDVEDTAGRPFVGPAGKLLDKAFADAGI